MSSRPLMRWITRVALGFAAVGGLLAGLFALAWMVIFETAKPASAPFRSDRSVTGAIVTTGHGMSARITLPGQPTFDVPGHGAPVVSARFTPDGRQLVTFDATGHVRRTDVAAAAALHGVAGLDGLDRLRDRLWQSYGRPLGQLSLAAFERPYPITFRDCPTCPEMVVVPAGKFLMGSPEDEKDRFPNEGPQHEVTIAKPLAVGVTHVTRGEFAAFVAATGHNTDGGCYAFDGKEWKNNAQASWRAPGFAQGDSHPVVCVNWHDAHAYVAWLKQQTGVDYRLLTEAEAEYGARGTTAATRQPRYFFGDDAKDLCKYGNGADLTAKTKFPDLSAAECNDGYVFTAPAGHFAANAFGVKDVHGNVWSWTEDCYADSYKDAPKDGSAVRGEDGCSRVLRGGSWDSDPRDLRSADRGGIRPGNRGSNGGFRVGRSFVR